MSFCLCLCGVVSDRVAPRSREEVVSFIGYLWLSEGLVRNGGTGHEWVVRAGDDLQPSLGMQRRGYSCTAAEFIVVQLFCFCSCVYIVRDAMASVKVCKSRSGGEGPALQEANCMAAGVICSRSPLRCGLPRGLTAAALPIQAPILRLDSSTQKCTLHESPDRDGDVVSLCLRNLLGIAVMRSCLPLSCWRAKHLLIC